MPLIDPDHLSPTSRRIMPRDWDNMAVNFVPGPSPLPALQPFVDEAIAAAHRALLPDDAANVARVQELVAVARKSRDAWLGAPLGAEGGK